MGALVLAVFLGLSWRALMPVNRHQPTVDHRSVLAGHARYHLLDPNNWYDDVVTQVTAKNLTEDVETLFRGLRGACKEGLTLSGIRRALPRSHFLPNRRGAPNASFYGGRLHVCESLNAPGPAPLYRNRDGDWVSMNSLGGDCIYIHYPPLADWVYGAATSLGLDGLVYYKFIAITLNCAFLVLMYLWLRREVQGAAAAAATVLIGTLPAFVRWADALHFQPFQYLFWVAGMLAWGNYLRASQRSWYALTWLAFLCESLVSHEMTLCFAITLTGLQLLDSRSLASWRWWALLAGQATAPLVGWTLHLGLAVGVLGFDRTVRNLTATLAERVADGRDDGFSLLWERVDSQLLPIGFMALGSLLVLASRRVAGAPLKRPLALLGVLFAGGLSFSAAIPGTASWHAWMMYRHLLPFSCLLLALVADALIREAGSLRRRWRMPSGSQAWIRLGAASSVMAGVLLVGWVAWRNARCVVDEVGWNLRRSRAYNPANLLHRALDVIHWGTSGRGAGIMYLPVAGTHETEPPGWTIDVRMAGPGASHYEVWWLRDQTIRTVRLLVDQEQAAQTTQRCFVGWFEGNDFRGVVHPVLERAHPTEPTPNTRKASSSYQWVEFSLPSPVRSRAVRLTCVDADAIAVRQLGVYSDQAMNTVNRTSPREPTSRVARESSVQKDSQP